MCQVFGVSRSGYYNWVQHEPSDRKQSDERLKLEIKVAHIRTRETYGTRRLQTELAENGIMAELLTGMEQPAVADEIEANYRYDLIEILEVPSTTITHYQYLDSEINNA